MMNGVAYVEARSASSPTGGTQKSVIATVAASEGRLGRSPSGDAPPIKEDSTRRQSPRRATTAISTPVSVSAAAHCASRSGT